jgi:nucleoside triphosphate diphosphatase
MPTTGERFERAVAIMERLRAPGGCPWDREQTFDTIKPFTLEETYEVLEAIDRRDWDELTGELGDLLLQVLFYSTMAKEEGRFAIDDVLDRLSNKLVDRHPHVFGEVTANTPGDVVRNWEALKSEEKKKKAARGSKEAGGENGDAVPKSILADISSKMPALIEAHKISSKAARTGFDWPDAEGILEKLDEEVVELREHLHQIPNATKTQPGRGVAGAGRPQIPESLHAGIEEELGDLLFVVVNLARHLGVDCESALRKSNRKFRRRFQSMEDRLRARGETLEQSSLEKLESLWQQAKRDERETA